MEVWHCQPLRRTTQEHGGGQEATPVLAAHSGRAVTLGHLGVGHGSLEGSKKEAAFSTMKLCHLCFQT